LFVSGEIVTPVGFVAADAGLANLVTGNTLENAFRSACDLIAVLPGPRARWAVLRQTARLLQKALGVPVTVSGKLPPCGRFVIVANHASFLDGLVQATRRPTAVLAAGRSLAVWPEGSLSPNPGAPLPPGRVRGRHSGPCRRPARYPDS
jgi:1-acyl-sn-glycerol-3-phosphate acyltransferase